MSSFSGETLSWRVEGAVVEVELHRPPGNEIGSTTLVELEDLVDALAALDRQAAALVLYSSIERTFSAGADLRQLYARMREIPAARRPAEIRAFLERVHAVMTALDESALTTIAAVEGTVFGGGFELALACDLIVAGRMARFCFPELRLGLVPGFGGIPRLRRDVGNAVVRDLLLTGRSLNASRAHAVGLVSQLTGQGGALAAARATALQVAKFDRGAAAAAKRFVKPIPREELSREIDIFCELFTRPAVEAGLARFVDSDAAMPYLP